MSTNSPRLCAVLLTRLASVHAFPLVALFDASVLLARQPFTTRHPAAETLLTARDSPPLLVMTVTPLCRLDHTGRTHGTGVAVV